MCIAVVQSHRLEVSGLWGRRQGRGASYCQISKSDPIESDPPDSHHTEAEPLHANLRDSQKPSNTFKSTDSLAAGHICTGSREDEDVRESACSGRRAKQDEVWGDSFGRASSNDSVMLGEI